MSRIQPIPEELANRAEAAIKGRPEAFDNEVMLPSGNSVKALETAAVLAGLPTEAILEIRDLSKAERDAYIADLQSKGVPRVGDKPQFPEDDFTLQMAGEVNRRRALRGRQPQFVREDPRQTISAEALARIRSTRRA